MENLEEIKQEETLPSQPSPKKKYLLIGVAVIILIVGTILFLKGMQSSSQEIDSSKAIISGKVISRSDVEGFPDSPIIRGTIKVFPEERFSAFVKDADVIVYVSSNFQGNISTSLFSQYDSSSSNLNHKGEFQLQVEPGNYIFCYFAEEKISDVLNFDGCTKISPRAGARFSVSVDNVFGRMIFSGDTIEEIELPKKEEVGTSTWQTYRNEEFGFEVKYPDKLDTDSIQLWTFNPESIEVSNQSGEFPCNAEKINVNGKAYCVTRTGDTGAGSVFHDYTYKIVRDDKLVSMRFVFRYTNCGAYGVETKEIECEAEKERFNADVFADKIFSTLQFNDKQSDTSGWQTYRSEEFGFEVKYPLNWVLHDRIGNINIRNEAESANWKEVYVEMTTNKERIMYIKEGKLGEAITIGDVKWDRFLHNGNNPGEFGDSRTTLAMLALIDDRQYIIRLTPSEGFEIDSSFLSILSTFQFIDGWNAQRWLDEEITSKWQIYGNEDFEFKYPPTFVIEENVTPDYRAKWALVLKPKIEKTQLSPFRVSVRKSTTFPSDELEREQFFWPFLVTEEDIKNTTIGENAYVTKKVSHQSSGLNFTDYFIEYSGSLYEITHNRNFEWIMPEETFNQILSTFRFIE